MDEPHAVVGGDFAAELPPDGGLVSPLDLLAGQPEGPDPADPFDGLLAVVAKVVEPSPADHPLIDAGGGVGVVAKLGDHLAVGGQDAVAPVAELDLPDPGSHPSNVVSADVLQEERPDLE